MELSDGEKLTLFMLAEIYRQLGIKNCIDPNFVCEAVSGGYTWALKSKYPTIFAAKETTENVRTEVENILDMWFFIEAACSDLSDDDKARVATEAAPFSTDIKFRGFNLNSEFDLFSVAHFVISNFERYSIFREREPNSRMPLADAYRRMYEVFEPMRAGLSDGRVSATQLIKILKVIVHPDRRPFLLGPSTASIQ